MFNLPFRKYAKLLPEKLALIDTASRLTNFDSIADLGGVWGVEGGYLFHALDTISMKRAVMVDTHPTDKFLARAKDHPELQVLQGNFGDPEIARQVGHVGAAILFDVLLHQVNPNWDEIIRTYANVADTLIIYNQQWTGTGSTERLLDLGEEAYFRNVPHRKTQDPYKNLFARLDQKHPDHDRTWRDVHHIWQWGIIDQDLIDVAEGCGMRLVHRKDLGRFGRLTNFRNRGFIFTR